MDEDSTRCLTSIQELRENRLSTETKKNYRSGLKQIEAWLSSSGNSSALDEDGSIDLGVFTYDLFTQFIFFKYQSKKAKPGTLASYRSAMKDYYKRKNVPLPPGYDDDVKSIFQGNSEHRPHLIKTTGIRRRYAAETQSGSIKDSGKRPLKYRQYQELCSKSLRLFDSGFTHLFLVLTWNLMCRSKSTELVQLDHLSDEDDAIGCIFYKSKTDQCGTKRRDPKHVYANPGKPEVCAFLALAIYLVCNPQRSSNALFPGPNQRDRFSKSLSRLTNDLVSGRPGDIGTHSIRKGAATFAIAGNTSGPSIVNVCIRCGWTLGHVVERYIHYDGAGDQYVGRVVAGLPLSNSGFACLPPHFPSEADDIIRDSIDVVFPNVWRAYPNLFGVLSLCLASLVFHHDFLQTTLPPKHQLLFTPLFANRNLYESLKVIVAKTSDHLVPTGIPPHVAIHCQIQDALGILDLLTDKVKTIIEDVLERNGSGTGNTTKQVLEDSLRSIFKETLQATHTQPPAEIDPIDKPPLHFWSGRWRRLPASFELPSVDLSTAWQLWWCGSQSTHSIPLKSIDGCDLTPKQGKVMSDWRQAMKILVDLFDDASLQRLSHKPTYHEVSSAFSEAMAKLSTQLASTPRGRDRRVSQMKLATFVRICRKWNVRRNRNA